MATASLDELRRTILRYRRFIGRQPYAHHVIGLVLSQIAKVYGKAAAKALIRDCGLEALGWKASHRKQTLRNRPLPSGPSRRARSGSR